MSTKRKQWQPNQNLPPISPDSRLLQPKNTSVKGRVCEEIRARTTERTKRLQAKTKTECLDIKEKVFNQFAKRMEDSNVERRRLNHYWRMKTKDSPYRYDQNEVDLRNAEALYDKKKVRDARSRRLKRVAAMSGEPFFNFYTDKLKETLGTEEKLAMEHFRLLEQLKVVKDEQATLEDFLHRDCEDIEMKFATIALQLATRRHTERSLTSTSNSQTDSLQAADWTLVSQPRISKERAREIKETDIRLYDAGGRWNESGQFVPVKCEQDKVGLMSSDFALVTGHKASRNLAAKKKDYGRLVEV